MAGKKAIADPFNGMADWIPTPTPVKPKRQPKAKTPPDENLEAQRNALMSIRHTAQGALARLVLIDMEAAAQDFEWIIKLANEGLNSARSPKSKPGRHEA